VAPPVQPLAWNIRPFIDGAYLSSCSSEAIDNINPATEEVLCEVPVGGAGDVQRAVEVARKRFEQGVWSDLGPDRRREILLRFAKLVADHKDELALLDSLEMGKPVSAARFEVEVLGYNVVRSAAELADKLCGALVPSEPSSLTFNTYEPRGVIGAIVPWNCPTYNTLLKITPALTAGNAVVLKPSEIASGSALKLAELSVEAGLPSGIFNVVPGLGRTVGEALVSHPGIDMVSFTGSTLTGQRVMQLAGQSRGRPVQLECGGKSPQLVFADADDLDRVAACVVQDIFYNAGQICAARSRLLVQESIKQRLLDKIVPLTQQLKAGDPLDEATNFGPLATSVQMNKVRDHIRRGLIDGAQMVIGDIGRHRNTKGYFVSPTILDNVSSEMSVVREEIFGPVLCVQSFREESEAIALANATDYGLTATAWTRDFGRARRLAKRINAGFVVVRTSGDEGTGGNVANVFALCAEPRKASGFGAEWGLKGLEAYSTLKAVQMLGT
jgi:acyl-CoA reductase-like NAD-dependent aldehyde dehydrogenase